MPTRQHAPRPAAPQGAAERGVPAIDGPLPERGRITARGVVDRITIAPATESPSFMARAGIDRNGVRESVRIIWMGQRRVPGVEAGVVLKFEGMLSRVGGTPTVYNPRYEIIGRPEEY